MQSPPSLDEYREQVREWLAANLERATGGPELRGAHDITPEMVDEQRALLRRIFDGGYAGITWPVEYGGQGLSPAHQQVFDEEASGYVLPGFDLTAATFKVCVPVMLAHGSPEFNRRHVPRILAGEELWAQFFSEPVAGSDLAGVQTRATRDGDSWILNGAKIWSSNAHLADFGMCLARTNGSVPKHRGLTWFAVPTKAPGLTLRPIRQINGGADFCEEFFDDVIVPDTERIGDVDAGWTVARTMLVFERGANPTAAADSVDPGPLAPDLVTIAREAGRTNDPLVRQLIARAHSNDYARRVLNIRITNTMKRSGADSGIAAYGALALGAFDAERAVIGMQIARGHALAWTSPEGPGGTTALAYLNGRINSIAGGTNEMQRNAISEHVLGLPREPSYDRDKPFEQVVRDASKWTS
jgi:alkylation response protein AidB-like acyl-CoA dehydrogenase